MLTLTSGVVVTKEQITRAWEWGRQVKGFAGGIQYRDQDGNGYMPYVTKPELQQVRDMGINVERILALPYSGTY